MGRGLPGAVGGNTLRLTRHFYCDTLPNDGPKPAASFT